jgi:HAD superfamily hydrolase (TIGR01484 family)
MKTLPEVWPYARPRALLTDLDDTVLEGGRLRASVLAALESLQDAGIAVVAVTGRPASWAEMAAHQWPLFGALGENGALSYRRLGSRVIEHDDAPREVRVERTHRLNVLSRDISQAFPSLKAAADSRGRISDRAWDIAENERVEAAEVARVRTFLESRGAKTAQSSIHVHATFERQDKATGALAFLQRELQLDPASALASIPFVGDSGNDRPCFSAFDRSVGVANIDAHLGSLARTPRFRTRSARSEGFLELCRALLAAPA